MSGKYLQLATCNLPLVSYNPPYGQSKSAWFPFLE